MQIPLLTIILLIAVAVGIVWVYPKLPAPWNLIFVGVVAIILLVALANLTGVAVIT